MRIATTLNQGDALINSTTARHLAGGVSQMTMWKWERDGVIPKPMKIRRRNYWPRAQFIAALTNAGRNASSESQG